jgi:hypothetical protein
MSHFVGVPAGFIVCQSLFFTGRTTAVPQVSILEPFNSAVIGAWCAACLGLWPDRFSGRHTLLHNCSR